MGGRSGKSKSVVVAAPALALAASSRARRLAAALTPYSGAYGMRGRWLLPDYTGLRNAAWAVRNARVANDLNPLALKLVVAEAQVLLRGGERLGDVLEAFAELLLRP